MSTANSPNETCTDYRQVDQTVTDTIKTKTFANATKNEHFPTDEQCIILPYIDGTRVQDYVYKIAEKVNPKDIRFCSRISKNRVSLYFSNKKIVDDFLDKHLGIEINKQFIKARRLTNPDKRIVISNAPPSIPHEVIAELMKSFNVELSSEINFLKFGIKDEKFSHLHSFRRQVYVSAETMQNLPMTAVLNYQNQQRRIFFNDDKVRCFICNEFGHVSAACAQAINELENKNPEGDPMEITQEEVNTTPNSSKSDTNLQPFDDETACQIVSIIHNPPQHPPQKRPPPSTLSNDSTDDKEPCSDSKVTSDTTPPSNSPTSAETTKQQFNLKEKPTKSKTKKQKTSKTDHKEPASTKILLEPIKKNFEENKSKYPVSFSNFMLIMDLVKGHSNPASAISDMTENYGGICEILKENYRFLTHRSMKIRFTKLLKKLKEYSPNTEIPEDNLSCSENSSDQDTVQDTE